MVIILLPAMAMALISHSSSVIVVGRRHSLVTFTSLNFLPAKSRSRLFHDHDDAATATEVVTITIDHERIA
jgi:hypothetical protein